VRADTIDMAILRTLTRIDTYQRQLAADGTSREAARGLLTERSRLARLRLQEKRLQEERQR